jgi:hypothetical protein
MEGWRVGMEGVLTAWGVGMEGVLTAWRVGMEGVLIAWRVGIGRRGRGRRRKSLIKWWQQQRWPGGIKTRNSTRKLGMCMGMCRGEQRV